MYLQSTIRNSMNIYIWDDGYSALHCLYGIPYNIFLYTDLPTTQHVKTTDAAGKDLSVA